MSTRPPRRRREPARGSNNVRTVLLGILVIVAGLGIGMLSAVVMHRGPNSVTLPPSPTVTPLVVPTTAVPLRTLPSAEPAPPSAAPAVTEKPTATPATASPAATVMPTPASTPTRAPSASPVPTVSPTPRATARPTPVPTLVPTAEPTRSPPSPAAVPTGFDIDVAQAVVRRYLDAIARGDNATARALLGASPGDATVPLPELTFVNSTSRFGSFVGRRTGDTSAAIEVQVTNGTQKYSIVYEVVQGSKGTIISGRDITRP